MFPQEVQDETMQRQAYRCQRCHTKLDSVKREHFDFVHLDGNTINTTSRNCQALCKKCHP